MLAFYHGAYLRVDGIPTIAASMHVGDANGLNLDMGERLYNVTEFLVYCYKQKYKEGENLKYSLNKFISFFKVPFISNNIKYRFIREDDFILGSGKIEKQYDDTNDFHKYLK